MGWLARLFQGSPKKDPVHITDANFLEEVLRSKVPVVVDVWSPFCGPCQQLAPIMMTLAARYDGRVKIAGLNARESPATAHALHVEGTPTVIYFRNGKEVERTVGFRGQMWHEEVIEAELLGESAA